MLLGLNSLHKLRIMHRDLKTANIFLTDDNIVKIGDLNVSKLARQDGLNYTQAGTPYYASPEVWRDRPYDFKSDVWSIGVITFEMCCLQLPFQAKDMAGLYKKVLKGDYKPIPLQYSSNLRQVVDLMLKSKSSERASITDILSLNFIQKIGWQFGMPKESHLVYKDQQ